MAVGVGGIVEGDGDALEVHLPALQGLVAREIGPQPVAADFEPAGNVEMLVTYEQHRRPGAHERRPPPGMSQVRAQREPGVEPTRQIRGHHFEVPRFGPQRLTGGRVPELVDELGHRRCYDFGVRLVSFSSEVELAPLSPLATVWRYTSMPCAGS